MCKEEILQCKCGGEMYSIMSRYCDERFWKCFDCGRVFSGF